MGIIPRLARHWPEGMLALTAIIVMQGCGGGAMGTSSPPPPPAIQVSVAPGASVVLLGNSQIFSATVTNSSATSVTWSVNGIPGGSATTGTITSAGIFTAPQVLPAPNIVPVTATSVMDPTKSATVQVTISSDVGISVTPGSAGVELGATLPFQAQITSGGHPDTSVRWSLSGVSCPGACGVLDAVGNYTAPQILPPATNVTVTAQSVADSAKLATATIHITSNFTLQLSAPPSLAAGSSATLIATLTPVSGSHPSPAMTWSLKGAGCSGTTCGALTTTTQASGSGAIPDAATYTAPMTVPNPDTVTVTVVPQADPTKSAQAIVTILPGTGQGLTLTPPVATLAVNHRITLNAQVFGVANTSVNWTVSGIPGGSASLGQICVLGSNPCQTVLGANAGQVDYLAPAVTPTPNPVSVQAASAVNSSLNASAQITVVNHVLVSVMPPSATLAPGAVQAFTASVLGSGDRAVVWQVQGAACSGGGVCGTIDANGIYTAPSSAPAPNTLQVIAISSDDTSQFGTANVTITTGANIQSLHPASVYAGGASGFTLRVDGGGFVMTGPGPGSTLLIGGAPRTTTCAATGECSAPVFASDVAIPASIGVQVQNPDGSISNAVFLVVVAPNSSDATVSLTSANPESDGNDIAVVEPTTEGVSSPGSNVDLNVGALGAFSVAANSCTLAGNPMILLRPATGTSAVDICVFSQSGLDTSMTYTISGSGDVAVIAKQPAGLGIIHLTLQVSANGQTGARTLFVQNANLDRTAASGALEVE